MLYTTTRVALGAMAAAMLMPVQVQKPSPSPIVSAGFIFETAPFPSSHASTIVEASTGLVAAWFGGTREGHKDVGIWAARRENDRWTPPVQVATGDGYPCWNPVLYQPDQGPLIAFLQGRAQPPRVVGHVDDVGGWWSNLVEGESSAARFPRSSQEQAGSLWGSLAVWVQHGA